MGINQLRSLYRKFGGFKAILFFAKRGLLWPMAKKVLSNPFNRHSYMDAYYVAVRDVETLLRDKYLPLMNDRKAFYSNSVLKHEKSKIVWFCWLQGMEKAPELVRVCLENIRRNVTENVVVLDDHNYTDYVALPEHIVEKYKKGRIPGAMFSDMMRLELLIRYGGTWIDATVLASPGAGESKLWKEIGESELFVYRYFRKGRVEGISNWFIHAKPGNRLLMDVRDMLYAYWRDYNCVVEYYIFHLFFSHAAKKYPEMMARMPKGNSYHALLLRDNEHRMKDREWMDKLMANVPFHKLNYRKWSASLVQES